MKKRTRKTAKRDSLVVWNYFRKHPEIKRKDELPKYIFKLIEYDTKTCPLCTIYRFKKEHCKGCPLIINNIYCYDHNGLYFKWCWTTTGKKRSEAADVIYKRIKAWRIR